MRMYVYDRAEAGEYLDALPLNRELRNLVGRMNALDGWAFSADLPASKWSTTAFGEFGRWVEATTQTVDLEAAEYLGFGDRSPAVQLQFIPDSTGVPWVETFDVSDGLLEVRLICHTSIAASNSLAMFRPGVFVNGIAVWGPTVTLDGVFDESWLVHGCLPVGAGTLTLQPMIYYINYSTGVSTLSFNTRTLAVRGAVR